MANPARDWIDAASCCEGPQPAATFGDLSRRQQREMFRLACAALLSIAFFIGIGMLPRPVPVPSRSLRGFVLLPKGADARAGVLHARSSARPARQRSNVQLASVRGTPAVEPAPASAAPAPDRRGNRLSRFFRTVFHGVQPAAMKAVLP